MTTLAADCPHCRRDRIGFALVGQSQRDANAYVFMLCQNCWMPAVAELTNPQGGRLPDVREIPPTYNNWQIVRVWPERAPPVIPGHLPPPVEKAFRQAEDAFPRPAMEEAAAASYGRALDVGTKLIVPDFRGLLYPRIRHLADIGRITSELAEWAHDIRALRNEALHDVDGIGRRELTHLRGLTDMVLRYLFTLPGMLADRRAEAGRAKE